MIIVKKSGYLKYKNFKFRCALGKAGINQKKFEGDNVTPRGTYRIIKVFYRSDRIKNLITKVSKKKIKKNMGWCDDCKSKNYNKLIKIPFKYSYERLFRLDHIYDLVIIINYNFKPIKKNRGSAIFIHIAKKNYQKTAGCIALKKEHLLKILFNIKKNEKIKII
jgi:L,D-peptidoglycan transpeptidase YkuD (ErfK/YbiS/YcfS/YnhG family)